MKNLKINVKKPTRPASVLVMSKNFAQSKAAFDDYIANNSDEHILGNQRQMMIIHSDVKIIFCHETNLNSIRGLEFDAVVWNASGLMSDTLSQVYSRIRPQYDVEVEY